MPVLTNRKLVTEEILKRIHNNEYAKGQIITETELAESMNLSRTPVRESLIELTANGVLEKIPRKGYVVREFDKKTKLDTFTVLAALDSLAATLAMPNLDESDFLKMHELIDLVEIDIKYKNFQNYNTHQEEFHQVYISKCDNPTLMEHLQGIKNSIASYLYYSEDTEALFEILVNVNDEHRTILQLLKEQEPLELHKFLMEVHWNTKYDHMI